MSAVESKNFLLLAAVDNRADLLRACIESLHFASDWSLVFVGQEFSPARQKEIEGMSASDSTFIWLDRKAGMHNAKRTGLEMIQQMAPLHCVASLDDDMELLPTTNFNRMARLARQENIGLVSGNWARSERQLANKDISNKQIKQAIVYTAGGLVFSEKITRLIVDLGERDFWCDNTEWSLASYLNGYQNLRYLGSLSLHRILSAGGRKSYVNEKRDLPSSEFIAMRPCNKTSTDVHGFHIPDQRDLTALAKFTHIVNRK